MLFMITLKKHYFALLCLKTHKSHNGKNSFVEILWLEKFQTPVTQGVSWISVVEFDPFLSI